MINFNLRHDLNLLALQDKAGECDHERVLWSQRSDALINA